MSDNTATAWLAENPKLMGVLFTIMVLLTQVGGAAAGAASQGP